MLPKTPSFDASPADKYVPGVQSRQRPRHERLRDLSDADLIAALRGPAVADAHAEFQARFHLRLLAYARRAGFPTSDARTCVADILADEAIRFAKSETPAPLNLAAYLIRAVRNRYLNSKRAAGRRDRYHIEAAGDHGGERVVTSTCSESAVRASAGPDHALPPTRSVLMRLAAELRDGLSEDDYLILMWLSDGVSHRDIAEWCGSSYDATTKRIWRLCRRLRAEAARRTASYPPSERSEAEWFLRRADPGAHRAAAG